MLLLHRHDPLRTCEAWRIMSAPSETQINRFDIIVLDYIPIRPYTYLRPAPSRGAFRDRHGSRGGMRWTRQRRAAVLRPGRGPAERRRPQGSLRSRQPREAGHRGGRRRCAVRTGVEMRPICIALRGGPNRVVPTEIRSAADASKSGRCREPAETTASRLRPLPGRARSKPTDHRVRNAGRFGAFVVTRLVCFLQSCTRGCGRTWRPAFRAPSFRKEGAGNTHNPGASAPRDRGYMAV
jgi:hypothetical protein